ncbi:ester cyclase [Aureivirga sp. CE67]|uniref:ester cyclase n=1 Tax=Aureivirga sp. CE67 TaxID=1788983 RepID=UPI0018CABA8C|nr:ester cyclase [Aureivirga sp. CE67]
MACKKQEVIKTLVKELFNNYNFEVFDTLFTKNMKSLGTIAGHFEENGIEELKSINTLFHNCFSDFHVEIKELFSEKEKVCVVLEISGKHDGDLFLGMEPKGKRFKFESFNVFYFEGNLISAHWGISNMLRNLEMLK